MKFVILLILISCSSCLAAEGFEYSNINIVTNEHKLLQYPTESGVAGPTIEILRLLLNNHDIVEETQFLPWSRAYKIAKTTPNTLVLSITRTPEREPHFHWITKVSQFVRSFISLKTNPNNKTSSFAEASTKLIAVERDSFSHKYLLERGFSEDNNLYIVSKVEDGIQLLHQNKVQLLFTDPSVIRHYYLAQNKNFEDFIDAPVIEGAFKYSYIALNKKSDPELVQALKQANKRIESTEEYKHFYYYRPLIDSQ